MTTTYNDLLAYAPLATYAGNRAMVDELPNIIRRAQNYIVQRMDHDLFATTLPDTVVDVNGWLDATELTSGFLEIRSLSVDARTGRFFPLLPRSISMLEALYSTPKTALPLYYGRVSDKLYRVFPRPGRPLTAKIYANMSPPQLAPGVQTNIITEQYPEAMEIAVLREAAVFNLDAPLAEIYEKELTAQLGGSNAAVSRKTRDETSQRPHETRNVTGN